MGILSSAQIGLHKVGSAGQNMKAGFAARQEATAAIRQTRWQMTSYRGKAAFDAKKLPHLLHILHRLKVHLRRYEGKKVGRKKDQYEDEYFKKLFHKISKKDRNTRLGIIQHEFKIFATLCERLVQVVSAIEVTEKDIELQENAQFFQDQVKMKQLANELFTKAKENNITLATSDMDKFLKDLKKEDAEERKKIVDEYHERQRFAKGKEPAKGLKGFFLHMSGLSKLGHKARKLVAKQLDKKFEEFNSNFARVRQEINEGRISDDTLNELKTIFSNLEALQEYYKQVDQEFMEIMRKIYNKEIPEIQNKCIIPVYAEVHGLLQGTGKDSAQELIKVMNALRAQYTSLLNDLKLEEGLSQITYLAMRKVTESFTVAIANIKHKNVAIIDNLQQQMNVTGRPGQ